METVVFSMVIGFLAILGVTSLIEWIICALGGRCCDCGRVVLVPVSEGDTEPEARLRCAYNSMRWDRWVTGGEMVLVNVNAGEELWAVCEAFALGRDDVHLRTLDEVLSLKGQDAVYKTLYSILY